MSVLKKLMAWLRGGVQPPAEGTEGVETEPDAHDAPHHASERERRRTTRAEDARIEAEARALYEKDPERGIAFLDAHAILFARHERTALPCLCRSCLDPAAGCASSGGIDYVRDFVVGRHRALFFWMPEDLRGEAKKVRASVRAAVRAKLERPQDASPVATEPRVVIDPFTKEQRVLPPRGAPRIFDPFTGKQVK